MTLEAHLSAALAFGLATAAVAAPLPRVDFGARLEPAGHILTGAGQVEPDDVLAYARALERRADPVIFMDYVDAHDTNMDLFFDQLNEKLAKLPWYAVPQIGLGFDDEHGKPYDAEAAKGKYDVNLKRMSRRLVQLGRPVYLRIGYEFHGSWNGYTPDSYRAVFRRVHDFLAEAGATNVATVWCAEAGALPKDYARFYPGDEVVDWWAIDLFSTDGFASNAVVELFMNEALKHRKPVMIGESTPRYVTTLKGMESWNGWFAPYFRFIDEHPNVKAFCYINWDWAYYAKKYSLDWADWGDARLQNGPLVAERFGKELENPCYLTGTNAAETLRALAPRGDRAARGARQD
ncbi:MAG: glycosyl hydrolase [Verrucomicrobiota bacterium]